MSIAASADALTTVEVARAYLGRQTGNDPTETDRIQLYINAFSRAVARYTGRQFVTESNKSKRFRYTGDGYLSLSPYELRSVTAIVLYSDLPTGSQVTLLSQSATVESQYRLEPRNGTPEGTYLWVALPETVPFHPLIPETVPNRRAYDSEVKITGDWGMAAVPADVVLACLLGVAKAFRSPEGFASRSMGGLAITDELPSMGDDEAALSLPRSARALLSPYKRVVVG